MRLRMPPLLRYNRHMSIQKPHHNSDWMIVYVTYNLADAHIVAGRLESDDIPTFIYREPGASALGIHIGRLGEIKVLVSPADYDRAQAVLFPDEPDSLPDETGRTVYGDLEETDDDDA